MLKEMRQETVIILCSGTSLGAYIPALIASHQLSNQGINSEVVVLENIFFFKKRDNIPQTKFAFHRNFPLALMAQKLAKDITPSIDPDLASNLLAIWKKHRRKRFMIFSGFWLPIANRYLQETDFQDITIDLCHMDASVSTSWKMYDVTHSAFRHIWFFNWEDKCLLYNFSVSNDEPVPYSQRADRFVIHGGGWGVGTYKSKIPELVHNGIKLDVIAYEHQDIANKAKHSRYFLIDPTWKPWEKDAQGHHQFPPFGEVKDNGNVAFENSQTYPEVYSLIRQSRGIISKPGGGTLVDSLSAATPLVWLAPYGDYENNNGLLWEYLGFGVSYEKWVDSGYSCDILERLHVNLKQARASLPKYITTYINPFLSLQGH